jgi:hypothetical protein
MKLTEEYRKKMSDAFDSVCDPNYWKGPIKAVVPKDKASLVVDAIWFFTATCEEPVDNGDGTVTITSIGYAMGPAGDH